MIYLANWNVKGSLGRACCGDMGHWAKFNAQMSIAAPGSHFENVDDANSINSIRKSKPDHDHKNKRRYFRKKRWKRNQACCFIRSMQLTASLSAAQQVEYQRRPQSSESSTQTDSAQMTASPSDCQHKHRHWFVFQLHSWHSTKSAHIETMFLILKSIRRCALRYTGWS